MFFVKRPGETYEEFSATNVPISHCDLLQTVLQAQAVLMKTMAGLYLILKKWREYSGLAE